MGDLSGSDKSVSCLHFDAEERNILGAGFDCAIRVWSLDGYQRKHLLTGHGNNVLAAKFAERSLTIVSGSRDGTIRIWDLKRAMCTVFLFHFLKATKDGIFVL